MCLQTRRLGVALVGTAILSATTGCQSLMGPTAPSAEVEDTFADIDLPSREGRASIAVRDFEWKVGQEGGGGSVEWSGPNGKTGSITWSTKENGYLEGLEDMLTDALVNCELFRVMERNQFSDIKEEVGLQEEGWIQEGAGPQKGSAQGADIGIYGAVVEFNPDAEESSFMGSLASKAAGFIGLNDVEMTNRTGVIKLIIRIYDLRSSEVLKSVTVKGEAKSTEWSIGGARYIEGVGLAGGLSEFKDAPMGAAVQKAIAMAVKEIADRTPERYFKYE